MLLLQAKFQQFSTYKVPIGTSNISNASLNYVNVR